MSESSSLKQHLPVGLKYVGRAANPRRISAIYMWIIFIVCFGVLQPGLYLTVATVQLVFSQGAVTGILALAFLIPLATDTYDLSVGEMMSLSIVLIAWFGHNHSMPPGIAAVVVVLICCLVGGVSGFVVVRLRVNSLIATLGMSQLLSGIQLLIANNEPIAGNLSNTILNLGNGSLFGIPLLDFYLVAIALAVWFVLEQTPLGRRMFAVGGNPEAARLAGIRTASIRWGSLMASGAVAGAAGVAYAWQVGSYTADTGQGYLFPALAAVFLGASQLSQRPNVWGTLIAFFALAFGIQGLSLEAGAGAFWVSPVFQGVALIAAVSIASLKGAVGRGDDGSAIRRLIGRGAVKRSPDLLVPQSGVLDGSSARGEEQGGDVIRG